MNQQIPDAGLCLDGLQPTTDHVLLVEDSKSLASVVQRRLETDLALKVVWAQTYAEAEYCLRCGGHDFTLSILDLNLPDAPRGEILDFVLEKSVPAIVFAGSFDPQLRDQLWTKTIIDYILKKSPSNIDYLVSLVGRIIRNRSIKVLVVDDSDSARLHTSNLLTIHQYQVFYAASGKEAIEILSQHPDIKLVIADFSMPDMDGLELTERIRLSHGKNELAVIGMSTWGNPALSAQFIKTGANDFLTKPFSSEEFYCRVSQNIEILEHIETIRNYSNKDFLTDLYNRRYFFDVGEKLLASAKRGHITVTAAMIDIDHFKMVNDTHGHEVGDLVLKHVSTLLRNRFRQTDIVCRYGGEEFCILAANMDHSHALAVFDGIRQAIEKTPLATKNQTINITVSIGICIELLDSLEEMIKQADLMLYEAKRNGRNMVLL